MELKKIIGKLKFYQNRLSSYWNIIIALQVSFLFVITDPIGISRYIWLFIIFFTVFGIIVFDHFFVSEEDIDYWFKRSKSYRRLCNKVDEIYERIK